MNSDIGEAFERASIDEAVRAAYPQYSAALILATGLNPGPSSEYSEQLLTHAETSAVQQLSGREPHELPEIQAWRDAYLSFGVKPRVARSSVEALMRRTSAGLPRIDRLTDVYNAVSIMHLTPIGGEDISRYAGPARLVIADGTETFDTVSDGQNIVEHAEPGEVIWRDDMGVTCRRWNWRQCVRTRLGLETTDALFIIDSLGGGTGRMTAEALIEHLAVDSPTAEFAIREL